MKVFSQQMSKRSEDTPRGHSTVILARLLLISVVLIVGVCALTPGKSLDDTHLIVIEPLVCNVEDTTPSIEKPPVVHRDNPLFLRVKKAECLFHPIILEAAGRYKIDPALVKAIILAESEYNPKAISKKGAKGLMQLMPRTAEDLGVKNIFDPEHNINGGVKYFKRLLDRFDGNVELALAAYNAGSRKVREYGGIPPFKATKYYINNVFRYYEYYKNDMTGEMDSV